MHTDFISLILLGFILLWIWNVNKVALDYQAKQIIDTVNAELLVEKESVYDLDVGVLKGPSKATHPTVFTTTSANKKLSKCFFFSNLIATVN